MNARKPIFDTVRKMLGRGFTQGEVDELDAVLDSAIRPTPPSFAELRGVPRTVSAEGRALIRQFEGCRLNAYPDPGTGGEPITIGWGATRIDGHPVRLGDTITQAQADRLLDHDIQRHADEVRRLLDDAPTSQAQFDALTSFHFNTGALGRSTLLQKHKAGDHAGAAKEFARWTYAGERKLKGLIRRRKAEAALYREGMA